MDDKNLLTIPEAAKLIGISRISTYRAVKAGKIPAKRVGRFYLIRKEAILSLLAERKSLTSEEKKQIREAVKYIIREYRTVLERLGKE